MSHLVVHGLLVLTQYLRLGRLVAAAGPVARVATPVLHPLVCLQARRLGRNVVALVAREPGAVAAGLVPGQQLGRLSCPGTEVALVKDSKMFCVDVVLQIKLGRSLLATILALQRLSRPPAFTSMFNSGMVKNTGLVLGAEVTLITIELLSSYFVFDTNVFPEFVLLFSGVATLITLNILATRPSW